MRWVKLTQPVIVKSFQDELKLDARVKYPMTSSEPGKVLSKGYNKVSVSKEEQTTYRSAIGKMLRMMLWSIPDIISDVRECLMMMSCTM